LSQARRPSRKKTQGVFLLREDLNNRNKQLKQNPKTSLGLKPKLIQKVLPFCFGGFPQQSETC